MQKAVLLLGALVFLFGCTASPQGLLYYEIVLEKSGCKPYCSLEYIVLSNGLVMKKQSNSQTVIENTIEIVKTTPEKAAQAIKFAQDNLSEQKFDKCNSCDQFVFFTNKKPDLFMFVSRQEEAPDFLNKIFENSQNLFSGGEKVEQFFVQFVFKKIGKNAVDYHFYPDGSVVKETYVGSSQELAGADAFMLNGQQLGFLKSQITGGLFDSKSGLENCQKNGLEYGYLEVLRDGEYIFEWTCGTRASKVDTVFNEYLREFG